MNQKDHTDSLSGDSGRPNKADIIRSLLELRGQYADEHQDLQEHIEALLRKMEALELLIDAETAGEGVNTTAGGIPSDEVVESPMSDESNSEATTEEVEPVCGAATIKDIIHCRTQREAGYAIAEVNGGYIDLKSAAPVIKAAGLSKGMLNTIVSSLHHFMSHSDDWRYTGPSAFELLTFREVGAQSTSEPDSGNEDSPESNILQDNSMMAHIIGETAA